MARKRYTPEQIIAMPREAEIKLSHTVQLRESRELCETMRPR